MHEFTKDATGLKDSIRRWGKDLGFDAIGFSGPGVGGAEENLNAWLAAGCHGDMDYMAAHVTDAGNKRALPTEPVPGTRSIITARMNYRSASADSCAVLADGERAFVSRYALGRDYHKLLRNRLQKPYKMKFGHHGGNHPVRHEDSGRVAITSQNHGFAVDIGSLGDGAVLTHRNLFDGTTAGLRLRDRPIASVQYHPEASPGPHDASELLSQFVAQVRRHRGRARAS